MTFPPTATPPYLVLNAPPSLLSYVPVKDGFLVNANSITSALGMLASRNGLPSAHASVVPSGYPAPPVSNPYASLTTGCSVGASVPLGLPAPPSSVSSYAPPSSISSYAPVRHDRQPFPFVHAQYQPATHATGAGSLPLPGGVQPRFTHPASARTVMPVNRPYVSAALNGLTNALNGGTPWYERDTRLNC